MNIETYERIVDASNACRYSDHGSRDYSEALSILLTEWRRAGEGDCDLATLWSWIRHVIITPGDQWVITNRETKEVTETRVRIITPLSVIFEDGRECTFDRLLNDTCSYYSHTPIIEA